MSKEVKGEVVELMRRMGVKGHPFDPMPPDQHKWQRGEGEPPLYRIWSWMCAHTIHYGHRSEFAVNQEGGRELHIEHMAKDLGMDVNNCRRSWSEGVIKGLWRNGTTEEGKRKLYLCGSVRPEPVQELPDQTDEKGLRRLFQPYIWKQIKDWPEERITRFAAEEQAEQKLDTDLRADFDAARRALIAQRQDTRYERWGVKKIREDHFPKDEARALELAERQVRVSTVLLPAIQPAFEELVDELSAQTISELVQTSKNGLRNGSANGHADGASLLGQKLPEDSQKSESARESGGRLPAHKTPSLDGGKPAKQLPAPDPPVFATPEQREARDLLFSEILRMQQTFKHSDFSKELISPARPNDQLLVWRVLQAVGPPHVLAFLLDVAARFKGLDRNSLGKLPGRSPGDPHGPRSLGLILEWAKDFAERKNGPRNGDAHAASS